MTTAGKLARLLVAQEEVVVLGAADTFRAAAADQLQTWGERVGAEIVRGREGADPASVAFDAVARFTVNPPAGAGSVNCTVLCVCAPGATTMLLGSTNALPRTVTVDRPVASPSA